MPESRHVFISYSRTDSAVMQRVKQSLLDAGLPCWTDEGIEPGTPLWQDEIEQAIERSFCIVVLLSPDAKKSVWVKRELNYADTQNRRIFPLMVRGDTATSVPFALIGSQYVDIQVNYDAGMTRLLPMLARIYEADAPADPEVTVVSQVALIAEADKPRPLIEHIPTLEAAPVDYSKIRPVTRNKDWTPIIRVINGIEMCLVPPGCFMMGSEDGDEDERPVHQRCIDKPFWIGRYPVTNAQYGEAVQAGLCRASSYLEDSKFNSPQQPVVGVSWHEAWKFTEWKEMRLPAESEWEYAARGPESWVWPWGNHLDEQNLVYGENSDKRTAQVGSKPNGSSWIGALDMSGNIWEWCLTRWRDTYTEQEDNDPTSGGNRVVRGGAWNSKRHFVRAASRNKDYPDYRYVAFGFRLLFDPFAARHTK